MLFIALALAVIFTVFGIICYRAVQDENRQKRERNAIFNSIFEETNGLRK